MSQIVKEIIECDTTLIIGRYYFRYEEAKSSHTCKCGNKVKKGTFRLHISGKSSSNNELNPSNICLECANKLYAFLTLLLREL